MDIDGTVEALEIIAEGFINEFRPAEHSAGFFGKNSQQLEFNLGQAQWSVVYRCLMFYKINCNLA